MNIHRLSSGATIIITSPGHGFKFSDGTEAVPQTKEVCDKLTLRRIETPAGTVKGMALNRVQMVLDKEQLWFLDELTQKADLVLVPFPVLVALREQWVRDEFPTVVAFNATPETQRAAPNEKVVDINNWSF